MNAESDRYAEDISSPETEILYKIHRETYIRMPFPRMMAGQLQGLLLKMVSQMIRPERILEIGTFTGYSAICLAQGLSDNGVLDTLEMNIELKEILEQYFLEAGLQNKIRLHLGDALTLLPGLEGPYDLVYLDADKEQYLDYYELVYPKVRTGGFILADNVLWGGKVLGRVLESDKECLGIQRFNERVRQDDRVERLLLPFRDGLMFLRKKT